MSELIEEFADEDGRRGFLMWCPGCHMNHGVIVSCGRPGPQWEWNGSKISPTFTPSILVRWTFGEAREPRVCHSFIRDGQWQFLDDCTHVLAGQTVPMTPTDGQECQHDRTKPSHTLRACHPEQNAKGEWRSLYRCNVCAGSFYEPLTEAQGGER